MNAKMERFIQLFDGNATQAALAAGYSAATARTQGFRLMKKDYILQAIKERELSNPKIASRRDRQLFWSDAMNDPELEMRDRLKASELLGKSEADFTENIKADMTLTPAGILEALNGRAARQG
jgi:phage terminase small subunit